MNPRPSSLPDVLFVDARGADDPGLRMAFESALEARRQKLKRKERWSVAVPAEDREKAVDQVDEARCLVVVWSSDSAHLAAANLTRAVEVLGGLTVAPEAREAADRFAEIAHENGSSGVGIRAALQELAEPRFAPILSREKVRVCLDVATLAAIVATQRRRLVWLDVSQTASSRSTRWQQVRATSSRAMEEVTKAARNLRHWGGASESSSTARDAREAQGAAGEAAAHDADSSSTASRLDERVLRRVGNAAGEAAKILQRPLTFEEVVREELIRLAKDERIFRSRRENVFARAHESQLVGLAFSGGGIRSATFNLGVLQALARHGLLRSFHYLSTVSGGGYIGAWLSAWMNREPEGLVEVERRLRSEIPLNRKDVETPLEKTWSPINWLRQFSNYLTPSTGLLSLDTWTAIVTYLRNLTLNLAILTFFLTAVLLFPWLLAQLYYLLFSDLSSGATAGMIWPPFVAATLFVVSLGATVARLGRTRRPDRVPGSVASMELVPGDEASPPQEQEAREGWFARVLLLVVLPLFATAILLALWIPTVADAQPFAHVLTIDADKFGGKLLEWLQERRYPWWILASGLAYLFVWTVAASRSLRRPARDGAERGGPAARERKGGADPGRQRQTEPERGFEWWRILFWAFVSGAFGGALLCGLAPALRSLAGTGPAGSDLGPIAVLTWGPPAVVLVLLLTAALHIGLIGRGFAESFRQWWSRLGAWQLILGLGWASLFVLVFYGPAVLERLGAWAETLSITWIAATAAGLIAGRSPMTGTRGNKRMVELVAVVAPHVFMLGLLVSLSALVSAAIPRIAGALEGAAGAGATGGRTILAFSRAALSRVPAEASEAARGLSWQNEFVSRSFEGHWWLFAALFGVALGMAALLSWRVDVNEFSMHHFYRNRLVRAYLGASRWRKPVRFTGFDEEDDLPLSDLTTERDRTVIQTPVQILNTTVNLTAGEELAFQERKASSFFFTPFHFGFDPGRFGAKLEEAGFRRTPAEDRRFTLGTALAISGAALNPNMGYHSSPALAFLMTVFNSRLGWWLRNPKLEKWEKPGPRFGLNLLLDELRGNTGARAGYVNLADGGFFENLGIYELVRRRCRFILACDAEADPNYQFTGLGNAIRRCRSDFGIDIQIQLDQLRPQADTGFSGWHCAVGTIRYGEADEGAPDGTLVYLKASLTGDEPEDLLNYASRRKGFPHESTADQWFGESQFESYRMLGYHQASELLGVAGVRERSESELAGEAFQSWQNIEKVFVAIERAWYPPSSVEAGSFTRHTEKLVRIFDQVRDKDELEFLDKGLYLDTESWKRAEPAGEALPIAEEAGSAPSEVPETLEAPAGEGKDPSARQRRAGFYLSSSMIQLMEDVYLDLDLEQEWAHPDNRGWMNLFRHWASLELFRETWAVSAATYGARFQTFCRRRLNLGLGTVWIKKLERVDSATGKLELWDPDATQPGPAPLTTIEANILNDLWSCNGAGKLHDFYLLEMTVLKTDSLAIHQQRNPFERQSELAASSSAREIVLGLAATASVVAAPAAGAANGTSHRKTLRYFRVRNHLRQLGLARQALLRLIVDHRVRDVALLNSPFSDLVREADVKNQFRSVLNEYYRWKDSLLAGVYSLLKKRPDCEPEEVRLFIREAEQTWNVASGTVAELLAADLEAAEIWLARTHRKKKEARAKFAFERGLTSQALERILDAAKAKGGSPSS